MGPRSQTLRPSPVNPCQAVVSDHTHARGAPRGSRWPGRASASRSRFTRGLGCRARNRTDWAIGRPVWDPWWHPAESMMRSSRSGSRRAAFAQRPERFRRPPARHTDLPRLSMGAAGRAVGTLAVVACVVGCGASTTTPPVEVVQNYLNQLGSGNYAGACSLLDKRARESSTRLARPRVTCEKRFARCLPHTVTSLPKDQTQLFYSNIQVTTSDSKATATVSGTAVARAIRHVTLSDERGNWKLTSYGQAVDRCKR